MLLANQMPIYIGLKRLATSSNSSSCAVGLCRVLTNFRKSQTQFGSMELRNSHFAAFIECLTANTYIMVVLGDTRVQSAAMLLNIEGARKHFRKFGLEDSL